MMRSGAHSSRKENCVHNRRAACPSICPAQRNVSRQA